MWHVESVISWSSCLRNINIFSILLSPLPVTKKKKVIPPSPSNGIHTLEMAQPPSDQVYEQMPNISEKLFLCLTYFAFRKPSLFLFINSCSYYLVSHTFLHAIEYKFGTWSPSYSLHFPISFASGCGYVTKFSELWTEVIYVTLWHAL